LDITEYTLDRRRGFERISEAQWKKDSMGELCALEEIQIPIRSTFYSSGYDIFSPIFFRLNPTEDIVIATAIKAYMMKDECLMIYPRSSLSFKYYLHLANNVAVIDSDYYGNTTNEGHIWLKIRNDGHIPISIEKGKAIAQGIFQKVLLADRDGYTAGKLREGGFGSTG